MTAHVSIRIDEALVNEARAAAQAEGRTLQGQIEFWVRVGRAALDNPDLPASFIAECLMGMQEPREISAITTGDDLGVRASRADSAAFRAILDRVPNRAPLPDDD